MIPLAPLAFVDLETTGLSPTADRIAEIGVVTVDEAGVEEWSTFVNPGRKTSEGSRSYTGIADKTPVAAPRFKDIAAALACRLAGRLFIAHNARFDFGFLRAEFQRLGIEFQPQVLCSVMLSRKLYSEFGRHDLDSLMERHTLTAEIRHRALPDAQLLWQFWQVIQKEHPQAHLSTTIEALLAGPVLPVHLDPSLIDRLPESPGVYVLHGEHDTVLHAGKADNLKLHLLNHFRIDRTSRKALEVSHLVRNITWRITRGAIGAHLQLKALSSVISPAQKRLNARAVYTWRLKPDTYPCVELIHLSDRATDDECYGIFESERKARNALLRVATNRNLCQALLAVNEAPATPCTGWRHSLPVRTLDYLGGPASQARRALRAHDGKPRVDGGRIPQRVLVERAKSRLYTCL